MPAPEATSGGPQRSGLPLPNLLIAGVTKAGTTSLFNYLASHPDVCPSSVKEPQYFSVDLRPGPLPPLEGYAELVSSCPQAPIRMEATPHYWLGGAPVIAAIKQTLERPRVIILLRDPVARLWSLFNFYKSRGMLDVAEPFATRIAIWEQEHRDWETGSRERPSALTSSQYHRFLPPWFEAFGDDLLLLFAEHLAARPTETVECVYQWLGIDPAVARQQDFEHHNATALPRNQRVARLARALAARTNVLFRNQPAVRALLRNGYRRINTKAQTQRMTDAERARLQSWFDGPNDELRRLLAGHGYTDVPAWLSDVASPRASL